MILPSKTNYTPRLDVANIGAIKISKFASLCSQVLKTHQSSRTAPTTSALITRRPLQAAVTLAAATSTAASAASASHGTCKSILQ